MPFSSRIRSVCGLSLPGPHWPGRGQWTPQREQQEACLLAPKNSTYSPEVHNVIPCASVGGPRKPKPCFARHVPPTGQDGVAPCPPRQSLTSAETRDVALRGVEMGWDAEREAMRDSLISEQLLCWLKPFSAAPHSSICHGSKSQKDKRQKETFQVCGPASSPLRSNVLRMRKKKRQDTPKEAVLPCRVPLQTDSL